MNAPDFPDRFRGALRARLKAERGAGEVEADVRALRGGKATAARVREATKDLPKSWVAAGNRLPVAALRSTKRGKYYERTREASEARGHPAIDASTESTVLHEYVHHVQRMAPDLDAPFAAVHRRRTAGEPVVSIIERDPNGRKELGRRDKYVDWYQGREYGSRPARRNDPPVSGAPREVVTMACQMLLHRTHKGEMLRELLERDSEMADLALGALFRYDP